MQITSHVTVVQIVPTIFNKCNKLRGKRVKIFYQSGDVITAYLRRVIDKKHILINCEKNGLYRLPMGFIINIEEC